MYTYKTSINLIDKISGGLEPGSNILILTPALTGGEQLGYTLTRPQNGEYSIILSTEHRSVDLDEIFSRDGFLSEHIGVIDTVTKLSSPHICDTARVKYVASPSDLTGIGIKFSQIIEAIFNGEFNGKRQDLFPPPVRFCLHSLSTLLMYRKVEVLYQFLHVLTAKLKKMDAIGIYILNSESFDDRTISLMKQLMSVVIEVKSEQEEEYVRIRGIPGIDPGWVRYQIRNGIMEVVR